MNKWDSMEPRVRDAWVAENVMGWGHVIGEHPSATVWCKATPTDRQDWWKRPDCVWWECQPCDDCLPHYTTDAAADYLVLAKVQEMWPSRRLFMHKLNMIWKARVQPGPVWVGEQWFDEYQPGDYSHAAYLTLEGT